MSYKLISLNGGNNSNMNANLSTYISLLLQFRTNIKMFHWQTSSFAHHKISDELLSSIDDITDRLVEAICGLLNIRPNMNNTIQIKNYSNTNDFVTDINTVSRTLRQQNDLLNYTEIANIRDELLGAIDKALYLLSFS